MARNIVNNGNSLAYDNAGMVAALNGQKIVWCTASIKQFTDTDTHNTILSTIKESAGWRDGIHLVRFDAAPASGDTDVWCMYVRDVADVADDMRAYSALGSAVAGSIVRLIGLYEWVNATQSKVTLWVNGVKYGPTLGTYDGSSGGFRQDGDRVLIGQRGYTGTSTPGNGEYGDVAIFAGAVPTAAEITALTTQEVRKATAGTLSAKVFHALPPLENSVDDIVGPYTGVAKITLSARRMGRVMELATPRDPTLAIVGDPQNLSTARYATLGTFLRDYASMLNIRAILVAGDWADAALDADKYAEFVNARACVDLFAATGLPYTLQVGNHDLTDDGTLTRSTTIMDDATHLPMSLITSESWFDSQFATGVDFDEYAHSILVDRGDGTTDLVISLPFGSTRAIREWAIARAAVHSEKRVWIMEHAWQKLVAGELLDDVTKWGPADSTKYLANETELPIDPGGIVANGGADGAWAQYAQYIPNLAGVICGHATLGTNATFRVIRTGAAGNETLQICVNNQERGTGAEKDGDGYMQLLSLSGNTVTAEAYEAVTDLFPTAATGIFTETVSPIMSSFLRGPSAGEAGLDLIAPSGGSFWVAPSDDYDLVRNTRAIYVGVSGNIKMDLIDGSTVVRVGLVAGTIYPWQVKKIYSTLTTATSVLADY